MSEPGTTRLRRVQALARPLGFGLLLAAALVPQLVARSGHEALTRPLELTWAAAFALLAVGRSEGIFPEWLDTGLRAVAGAAALLLLLR